MHHPTNIIDAIEASNEAGRLALGIYLVHGYPSLEQSKRAFDVLQAHQRPGVIFECGLPVPAMRDFEVVDVIGEAHRVAAQTELSDEEHLAFCGQYRPNILLHMHDEPRKYEKIHDLSKGTIDAITTENDEFVSMLIQSSDPKSPRLMRFAHALFESTEQGLSEQTRFIYLCVMNGVPGELLPSDQVQAAVDRVARAAPRAKIFAGLGKCSVEDAKRIRRIEGIHGVSVSSEAMYQLSQGLDAFERWLSDVDRALVQEVDVVYDK